MDKKQNNEITASYFDNIGETSAADAQAYWDRGELAEVAAQLNASTSVAIELGEWDSIPTVVSPHYVTLADTMRDLADAVRGGNLQPYLLTLGA